MTLARGWATAICVASGPSLTDAQCALADDARRDGKANVIVVNDNWRKLPDADVLYACDGKWWSVHAAAVRAGFHGERWTHQSFDDTTPEREHAAICASLPWLHTVKAARAEGLGTDAVHLGGNSGYQAINLAYLFGARRILLIGFDLQRAGGADRGKAHWFGDHPKPLTQGVPTSWLRRFDGLAAEALARGLTIVNCTVATALTCFPLAPLADALCVETV